MHTAPTLDRAAVTRRNGRPTAPPRLRVAREGRDVLLTDATPSGALTWSSVLSLPPAIDRPVPQLAAAATRA